MIPTTDTHRQSHVHMSATGKIKERKNAKKLGKRQKKVGGNGGKESGC